MRSNCRFMRISAPRLRQTRLVDSGNVPLWVFMARSDAERFWSRELQAVLLALTRRSGYLKEILADKIGDYIVGQDATCRQSRSQYSGFLVEKGAAMTIGRQARHVRRNGGITSFSRPRGNYQSHQTAMTSILMRQTSPCVNSRAREIEYRACASVTPPRDPLPSFLSQFAE